YGTEINYIPASKIVSSWLFNVAGSGKKSKTTYFNLPLNIAHVEIIFQHEVLPSNEWIPLCGFDSKASYEPSWRTDVCITENLMENITRCICPFSGTFVVLLMKKSYNISPIKVPSIPMVVIVCCGCCFLQSTIAFVILLPNIYIRRCYISINFALLQFCLSVTATMSLTILSLLKFLPQEWLGLLSSSFAAVLLLSSSTLVAIVLIIQSELEIESSAIFTMASKIPTTIQKSPMKKGSIKTNTTTTTNPSSESSQTVTETSEHNHSPSDSIRKQEKAVMKFSELSSTNRGVKSAICLSWLLPILCAMCIPMVYQIIGHRLNDWWLAYSSPDFIIFTIIESLLLFLFILLFVTLMKHLIYLSRKYEKVKLTLKKRIGLLNRIALLYAINFLSHMFYLIYLNRGGNIFSYLFSITSILLGLMIILCFIIKVENYAVGETTSSSNKSSVKNSLDDFCTTTTINNSLNFYSSQDMEKDNKSLTMKVFSNTISSFPIDTKTSKATTSLLSCSQKQSTIRHTSHPRLADVQICTNEIIDLTKSGTGKEIPVNLNAQARSYELKNINMMSIYDTAHSSATMPAGFSTEKMNSTKCLDILQGISKDSIVGIRDNNLEVKKQEIFQTPTVIITLTNSDGKHYCDNLINNNTEDADGVLNLISNDLDYLLNRTQEVPTISASTDNHHIQNQLPTNTPPPPVAFANQIKSPVLLLKHDVIMEESEHEIDS
ncbi:CLUMA_CG006504, isoform A, partial [Clunio marinus]